MDQFRKSQCMRNSHKHSDASFDITCCNPKASTNPDLQRGQKRTSYKPICTVIPALPHLINSLHPFTLSPLPSHMTHTSQSLKQLPICVLASDDKKSPGGAYEANLAGSEWGL